MYTKIKRILAAIICLCLFVMSAIPAVAVSRYFTDASISLTQSRFKWFYEQEKNSLDVVYIGSSAVYKYDINVQNWEEYGFTSAGLCSAAQPFEATRYLIEETLKTQSPELFVIDIRQLVRTAAAEATGDEIYTDNKFETYYSSLFSSLKHSYTRWKMINSVIEDKETALSWNFEFLRHHNKWQDFESAEEMIHELTDDSDCQKAASINGISVTSFLTPIELRDYESITEKLEVPQKYVEILDDLISYIKSENINVLFISTPSKAKKSQRRIQNWLSDYFESKDCEYIDYLDYIDEIGLDGNTDFSDTLHTNLYGAEKWTRYFGAEINRRIGKPEHSQKTVAEWNEASENWKVERAKLAAELDVRIAKKSVSS